MDCSMPGFHDLHHLPELAQTYVHWIDDVIQPSCPLFSLLLLPSIFLSIRVFSNESVLRIRCPKYWSFSSALILPLNIKDWFPSGLTGLISFSPRDSQESSPTPQFKSINFLALSHLYGPTLTSIKTTGKTIALTIWTFVGKVTSLLFNMLSRFVIAFLPRRKCL